MKDPLLFIFGGLPGSGKTTLARLLAHKVGAVHLRIDTIETALQQSGVVLRGPEGYRVAYALAGDHLRSGLAVVADAVNPWPQTREAWIETAMAAGVAALTIEIICSDAGIHRRRVEQRRPDLPGLRLPTWAEIVARDYRPWPDVNIVIDTARHTVAQSVQLLLESIEKSL